jgi:hypothetical protein
MRDAIRQVDDPRPTQGQVGFVPWIITQWV